MLRDVNVQDAPPIMTDDEEAVEHAERNRWHSEEVHCRDRLSMVLEKSTPALSWLGVPRRLFHPTGDRPLRDVEAEQEQFPMDARCSSGCVLGNHPEDQLPHLLRRLSSPDRLLHFRNQSPIQSEAGLVPPDHRFRRDDDEGFFPL